MKTWADNGWKEPDLVEDTIMNQVTLKLILSAEKSAESAEKSAESLKNKNDKLLTERQKQILEAMVEGQEYSTEEIAIILKLKAPRTRQLLNELVKLGCLEITAATKSRRYIKKQMQ